MRLAILMTNTDESAFAQEHPDDGEKFTTLLHRVRPDWVCEVFVVRDGVFPQSLDFDGMLITGSPASVHDGDAWITTLEQMVRDAVALRLPLFGACFGHQVIAKALGAQVGDNPQGWVLGQLEAHNLSDGAKVPFYAAHKEQVIALPDGAQVTARTEGCEIAGFRIEDHVLTTQYHPEMTAGFIAALLKAFSDDIGPDITAKAALTLDGETDLDGLAEWIAEFFEGRTKA